MKMMLQAHCLRHPHQLQMKHNKSVDPNMFLLSDFQSIIRRGPLMSPSLNVNDQLNGNNNYTDVCVTNNDESNSKCSVSFILFPKRVKADFFGFKSRKI